MKASAFSYARASSIMNAVELLVVHGDRAKILSGGQSLVPAMNLRLIAPELVVDIGGIAELGGIAVDGDVLRIGALARHVDLQRSPEVAAQAPLLTEAIAHVAHPAIRNRGTVGGSLAHADPASELPACMVALNAIIVIAGPNGERRVAARDFFRGIYETALSTQELLIAVEVPVGEKNAVHFFQEFARRHGDYAIAGLAAQGIVDSDFFTELRMVFFAVGDRPILAKATNRLVNVLITPVVLSQASAALADELDPQPDLQASASMRRHLAKVLMTRCVAALLPRHDFDAGEMR